MTNSTAVFIIIILYHSRVVGYYHTCSRTLLQELKNSLNQECKRQQTPVLAIVVIMEQDYVEMLARHE